MAVGQDGVLAPLVTRLFPPEPDLSQLSAEARLSLADYCVELEEFEKALVWLDHTLEVAPGSERAWSTRGFILSQLGRSGEALAAYGVAYRLAEDGEAAYFAALVAWDEQQDAALAAAWLCRALERSPEYALDVEDDDALRPLVHEPTVRRALQRAHGGRRG